MALLSTVIKSILNGSKTPATTTGEMKSALGTMYDFVTDLLGTDSTDKAAARAALGAVSSAGYRNKIRNADFFFNRRGYASGGAITPVSGVTDFVGNPLTPSYMYAFDGWRVPTSGQSVTFAALGNGNILTLGSGGIEQVIPAREMAGGTYALKWQGTAQCTVNGNAVTNGGNIANLPANTRAVVKFFSGTLARVQMELGTACGDWEERDRVLEELILSRYYRAMTLDVRCDYANASLSFERMFLLSPAMDPNGNIRGGGPGSKRPFPITSSIDYFSNASSLQVNTTDTTFSVFWTSLAAGQSAVNFKLALDADDYA